MSVLTAQDRFSIFTTRYVRFSFGCVCSRTATCCPRTGAELQRHTSVVAAIGCICPGHAQGMTYLDVKLIDCAE